MIKVTIEMSHDGGTLTVNEMGNLHGYDEARTCNDLKSTMERARIRAERAAYPERDVKMEKS